MEKVIIYGAGNNGRVAYEWLKKRYDVLFFCDKDPSKQGTKIEDKIVCKPEELLRYPNVSIVIASLFYREILEDIKTLGLLNSDIMIFKMELSNVLPIGVEEELNKRTIDLGAFLDSQMEEITCKEITFCSGGSGVLDYVFLKQIAQMFGCKGYCEIGTYIGESINILSDCCEKLHSVTAPVGAAYSMREWCKMNMMPDYSEKLTYSDKIIHHFTDSKLFDYSAIASEVELYFIDGDHSYQGVYSDTSNIFNVKKKDAIVVWHDFKVARNQYNVDVVRAVYDVLGEDFQNVYVTNNNLCGIYLPKDKVKEGMFEMRERKYEENVPLYTYDIKLYNCRKWL